MNSVQLKDLCSVKSSTLKAGDVKNMNPGQYPVYGASGLIADIDSFQHENPALAIVKDGAGFGRVYKTPKKSSVVGTMQFILPNEDVDRDYLYYVLNHIDFNKYRSGATIPHIYFKDYSSVQIKKHSLSEQRIIAEKLDGVTGLIDKSYAELEEFDQLVKSRFIEMFGEIKERVPLSYFVSSLTAGKSLAGKENCSNKVINSGAVTFDEFDKKSFKNLPCDYIPKLEHKINSGDILISRMNTPLLVGAVAYVWNVEDNMYLPDRIWKANLRINADPVFLWKSLVAPEAKDFIRSWAGGTSGSMVNISKTKMLETPIIKAPLKLQKEFHQFVAKINKSKFIRPINA